MMLHEAMVWTRRIGIALGIGPMDMLMMFVIAPLVAWFITPKLRFKKLGDRMLAVLMTPALFWIGMRVAS